MSFISKVSNKDIKKSITINKDIKQNIINKNS